MRKRVVIGSAGFAVAVVVVFYCFKPPEPTTDIIFSSPYKPPFRLSTHIIQHVPSWVWLRRTTDKFSGPQIQANYLVMDVDNLEMESDAATGPDGVQVWKLEPNQIRPFRQRYESRAAVVMSLGVGMRDGMEVGINNNHSRIADTSSTQLSASARTFPTLRKDSLEILTEIVAAEAQPNGSILYKRISRRPYVYNLPMIAAIWLQRPKTTSENVTEF